MREIKFRYWNGQEMISGDDLAFEEYAPLTDLLSVEGIMQYVGIKDKNGIEIYEGDIVKITGDYKPGTYTVIWDNYRVAWWLKNIKQRKLEHDDDFYQLLDSPWQDREVIGNAYENPELLQEDE